MNLATLVRFLFGSRQAIIAVAGSSGSLLLGALFVLSAGFAREYDGEDLLHEPWHVILPMGASLVTSFVLFSLLYLAILKHSSTHIEFFSSYAQFLSLYWMTAPLAWIYAIPVEEYLSAGDAMRANLWFLGIVSVWRVLLITRCASVLFGSSYIAAFFLVMLFADSLALVVLTLTPLPIFNIMGGIRLTESEAIIRETACSVQFFGTVSLPIWFIGTCVVIGLAKRFWNPVQFSERLHVSWELWTLGALSLIGWALVLPYSQPPQQLRRIVADELQTGRIEQAVQVMSDHDRKSFPMHWDPPPWPGYGQNSPPLLQVIRTVTAGSASEWVREIYLDKLTQLLEGRASHVSYWTSIEDEEFDQFMEVLQNSPETRDIARNHSDVFVSFLTYDPDEDVDRKARIRSLLDELANEAPPDSVE